MDFTATVIGADGAIADALATVLSVLGPQGWSMLARRYPEVIAAVRSGRQ
jgi:thiamine biosynthesis lipoprotein ApbE